MGVSAGTRTISDGLVLALDAANTRSYPGSGTTWFDLSDRGNNGTLTNGPSFVRPAFLEPFGGAGSVYFDGSGDYLDIGSSTNFAFGTGDFTIEVWVYLKANNLGVIYSNEVANSFFLYLDSGNLVVRNYGTSNLFDLTGPSLNTWTHIALSRSGTDLRLFFNGVQQGSTVTNSTNWTQNGVEIGAYSNGLQSLNGYISNLRVVKGTALYTSNFTPKRESFVTQSSPYTSLLTCQNGTIRDASPNNFAITRVGNVTSVSYAPYISFDGTNDYVTASSNTDFAFGTENWTVDGWVYFVSVSPVSTLISTADPTDAQGIWFGLLSGNWYALTSNGAGSWNGGSTNVPAIANVWYHFVYLKISGVVKVYINGTEIYSRSDTVSLTNTNNSIKIGGRTVASQYSNSYISSVRILKGKGLTAAEVQQNYQNTKSRYGL